MSPPDSTESDPKAPQRSPLRWLDGVLDRALDRDRVRFIAGGLLLVGLLILPVSFATSDQGRTAFGPPLGADFTGFYTAGTTLLETRPGDLYDDRAQDELYHRLFPNLPPERRLPYMHPPVVAGFFALLALLPYPWAFACWLAVTLALYLAGLRLILDACPGLRPDRLTVCLLALSFEPFLFECWHGGQLSAVGFFSLTLGWWLWQRERPVLAGVAFGLCLYKPTFLVMLLPMLIITRSGRVLGGLAAAAVVFGALSVMCAGPDVCLGYAARLTNFARKTEMSSVVLPVWKFVDLNFFTKQLVSDPPAARGLFVVLFGLAACLMLPVWWRWAWFGPRGRQFVMAATVLATPVANVYVGVYDSVVCVLGAALAADGYVRFPGARPDRPVPTSVRGALLLLYVTAWFTQPLARATGLQVYTLVMVWLLVRVAAETHPLPGRARPRSDAR